jgi:hypothetical protein
MHFDGGYVLSINNYIAVILWAVVVLSKVIKFEKEYFGVFILLFLAITGLINFSVVTVNADNYHSDSGILYSGLGFNIFFVVPLLVYCYINRNIVARLVKTILKGSEQERLAKKNKLIDFYYNKFSDCDKTELDGLMVRFKDYPYEAQVALDRVRDERDNIK